MNVHDLPMGGCATSTAHYAHLEDGDAACQNEGYQVVYADPPWRYSFSKTSNRKVENHYQTMTQADLTAACPVPLADDAVLYLWATAPKLLEALEVLDAWGFRYVTQAVWDKERLGMGYWFRGQHELILVGVRGKVSPPIPGVRRSSVFRAPRGRHSAKPTEVRDHIAAAFPDARKVELFARVRVPGWDAWGNEA